MSARRALVAVLLALFVALSPLLGDMPAGGAEAAGRATIDQPGAQPAAAGRAETRAVLPLPTALPSVQDSVETPESLPLTAACTDYAETETEAMLNVIACFLRPETFDAKLEFQSRLRNFST